MNHVSPPHSLHLSRDRNKKRDRDSNSDRNKDRNKHECNDRIKDGHKDKNRNLDRTIKRSENKYKSKATDDDKNRNRCRGRNRNGNRARNRDKDRNRVNSWTPPASPWNTKKQRAWLTEHNFNAHQAFTKGGARFDDQVLVHETAPKKQPQKSRTIFWPQNVPTGRSDWLLVLPYCGRVFCPENGPCFLPAPCGGWHRDFLWLTSSLRIGPARFVPALTWNNFLIVNALTRGITSPAFLRLFKNIYFTASLILVSTMLSLLLFLHSSMLLLLSCFVFLSVFSFQVPHPFLAWHDLFPAGKFRWGACFALPYLALLWFDLI